MAKDILLTQNEDDYIFDIDFDTNGDFLLTEGLETAIFMSLFCEKRADSSEIVAPEYRRGDWSNILNDINNYEVGSKLWLLEVARIEQEALNTGINEIEESLNWLIEDSIANERSANGEISGNSITYNIKIEKENNEFETYYFDGFKITIDNN